MSRRDRLSNGTLSLLHPGVSRPAYDRRAITAGIVHLGVGAFHRAHQAVYVDDCLGAGEKEWGILGASLRSPDTRDALAPQDGLYTVAFEGSAGVQLRVVGALLRLIVAPENPATLLAALSDPAIRIVSLTVSEKAYLRGADGALDLNHPLIAADLAQPARPRTLHGFIVGALAARLRAGSLPFTVLCCDNLPANGATLRRLIQQFAEARDRDLARRIEDQVAFPSTMVDRIVPATTDEDRERISAAIGLDDAWPVKAEPFMQWVIEENFTQGRPAWENHGVAMVSDVRPFEEMKLRLLNGAHSGTAYLGLLLGHATVAQAYADPVIRAFVDRLWAEAMPTLDMGAGFDLAAYTAALSERFSNTALVHRTAQIAMDGSQKMPQRILAAARDCLRQGRKPAHLMLVFSAWIACCEARGSSLPAGHFTDPMDAELGSIFAGGRSPRDTVRTIFRRAGFDAVAGNVAGPLCDIAAAHLETLRDKGASAAIKSAARAGAAA
jgi:fructuronate reductase